METQIRQLKMAMELAEPSEKAGLEAMIFEMESLLGVSSFSNTCTAELNGSKNLQIGPKDVNSADVEEDEFLKFQVQSKLFLKECLYFYFLMQSWKGYEN